MFIKKMMRKLNLTTSHVPRALNHHWFVNIIRQRRKKRKRKSAFECLKPDLEKHS